MGNKFFNRLNAYRSFGAFLIFFLILGSVSPLFAQTATKLQILLPGMSPAPGTASGYTGTPETQTSGVPFQIIINATDPNWNVVPVSHQIEVTSSDPYATLPSSSNLINGSATLTVTLNSNGSHTVSAADITDPSIQSITSPPIEVVSVLYFTVTDIGSPYHYFPGQVTVGDLISQVEIIARDAQGNRVNNYTKYVSLSQHTDYGPGRIEPETVRLEAGKWKGNIRIFRAGTKRQAPFVTGDVWVRVNDSSIFGESNRFCALPRPYSRIKTIVPGETHFPGSLSGKSGFPSDQQAGGQFSINVYTTDEYWNQVPEVNTTIAFTSSDPAAVLPGPTALAAGHLSAPITLNSNGLHTVTATDHTNPAIAAGVSSSINVISFQLHHFVFSTITSPKVAGIPFSVNISAVDAAGNPVTDFSGDLDLSASTGIETITPRVISMMDGVWSGQITLTRAASFVSISVQDRTPSPHTGTSNQFEVQPGVLSKLQVLLPGETATPGIPPGFTGTVGSILAGSSIPVRVNAVDGWWNIVATVNHIVHLSSSDPDASLPPDAPLFNGTRQFNVTLNRTGLHTVSAHDITQPSVTPGTSSQILVNSGNLYQFTFSNIVGPVTAGLPFSISITAEDQSGNRLVDYSGTVTLSASTGTGTVTPVNIVINQGIFIGNVTLTKAAEGVSLSVSDGTVTPHTGTSNQFRVNPGTLTKFQVLVPGILATPGIAPGFTGSPNDQRSGQPFPIQINGVDTHWNVVTTAADSFGISSTDLTASLPGNTVLVSGTRTLSITLNSPGMQSVTAFHLNNPQIANGQSPYINVIPQNLDHFAFSPIQSPANAGVPFTVTLRAETNLNQIVGNFNGMVNLTISTGANTIIPQQAGPFVNGEWTGSITLTKTGSNVFITASDDVLPPHTGTSNLFDVLPGAFQKLQVLLPGEDPQPGIAPGKSGTPLDHLTGEQFEFRVRAVDVFWNLISGAADSILMETTDPLAQIPVRSKLTSGLVTLTAIMGSIGTHNISASDISNPNITGDVSSNFRVNPGNLDHFEFQTIVNQTAGADFQVQIYAADIAGNPLTGFNGRARLEASTGNGTLAPAEIDFVDGYWNGRITITKAASNVKVTCLDFAATPHIGESNFFDVNPGPFTRLQILLPGEQSTPGIAPGKSGTVGTQIAGDAVPVTVNAVDNWWNAVTTAAGIIGLTSTDLSANIPLDASLISGTVTFATFRFMTPGNWTITAVCKTNSQISSDTSPLVNVITGSVASFMFEPISSPQFAGDTLQLTVHAVDGSGIVVTSYNEMASMTASTGPQTLLVGPIQFSNGHWTGPVVLTKAAQSVHINIHDFDDIVRGNSNPFTLLPGALARIKILVPGETLTPGLPGAKTGFPAPQTIGITFQTTVYATDSWYNPVTPGSLSLRFSSTDPAAVLPADTLQTMSAVNYDITLLNTGPQQLIVETLAAPLLSDSSSEFSILTGQVSHFVFSTIADSQIAGSAFPVRIEAHNQFNFPLLDYEGELILSASTGNGTLSRTGVTLSNGFWQGQLEITKADSAVVLYAADYIPAPNTHTGYSNSFSVLPEQLAALQVLLPGEKATPGVNPGKKDPPSVQVAGGNFSVKIRAVDPYWNLVSDRQDTLIIAVSDTFAFLQDTVSLVNGEAEIPVTLRAAGHHQVTARFRDIPAIAAALSDSVLVNPNQFTQLLILLPGEILLPGDTENDPLKTPGRHSLPTRQTAGLAFPVEVLAVDDYWNHVPTAPTDLVHLFTTDITALIVPGNSSLSNGKTTFSVTLNQGGNQIIRALDDSNPGIRTSLDAQVGVLVGGLHYEVILSTDRVPAGDPFDMQILFKNGNDEVVISASHLVNFSVVDAATLAPVSGTLQYISINLANGQRTFSQSCNAVGLLRIKVEDQINTPPAYSDPLEVFAGSVQNIVLQAPKQEVRALEKLLISISLTDAVGNPVPEKEVSFSLFAGHGSLADTNGISDASGVLQVEFIAGRVTETNILRAKVDSVYTDFEIVVNLTPSTTPDGVPINYPNPFGAQSAETRIDYYLSENADVTLRIFDLFGNLVWSMSIPAGSPGGMGRDGNSHPNSVIWNGTNSKGQKVGSGGYILIAKAVANGRSVMDTHRKIAVVR